MPARTDSNQRDVVKALRQLGAIVTPMHYVGNGFPDLLVGFNNQLLLFEVKSHKGRLTPKQREFFRKYANFPVAVVRSPATAVHMMMEMTDNGETK